jgi:hypothetical protein
MHDPSDVYDMYDAGLIDAQQAYDMLTLLQAYGHKVDGDILHTLKKRLTQGELA